MLKMWGRECPTHPLGQRLKLYMYIYSCVCNIIVQYNVCRLLALRLKWAHAFTWVGQMRE